MTRFNSLPNKLSNIALHPFATKLTSFNDINKDFSNDPVKRVLIIDDQEINVRICQKLISKNSPNSIIYKAYNGLDALKIITQLQQTNNKIDLIISDIQMPLMNGIKMVKKIRKSDKEVPIIAYTSRSSQTIKNLALEAGFDDYFTKPTSNITFNKIANKWLIREDLNFSDQFLRKTLSNKKIIIADDEPINLMILNRLFSKFNIKVEIASNGLELIKKYKEQFKKFNNNNFDVIITDISMPKLKGYDAAKIIRKYEILNNIENRSMIIANSCHEEEAEFTRSLKSGVDDFFQKGKDNKILLHKICKWLSINYNYLKKDDKKNIYNNFSNYEDSLAIINNKISKSDISELKKEFINSSKRLVNAINLYFNKNDLLKLSSASHSLKGITGNIGAKRLFYIVVKINNCAKFGKKPNTQLISKLNSSLLETTSFLKKNF